MNSHRHSLILNLGTKRRAKYDIKVDTNGNGFYDINEAKDTTDVTINETTGFFVLPEYTLGALGALGACFASLVVKANKQ